MKRVSLSNWQPSNIRNDEPPAFSHWSSITTSWEITFFSQAFKVPRKFKYPFLQLLSSKADHSPEFWSWPLILSGQGLKFTWMDTVLLYICMLKQNSDTITSGAGECSSSPEWMGWEWQRQYGKQALSLVSGRAAFTINPIILLKIINNEYNIYFLKYKMFWSFDNQARNKQTKTKKMGTQRAELWRNHSWTPSSSWCWQTRTFH